MAQQWLIWLVDSYAFGGLGSRSTLSKVRMSSLGSWQCCNGLSPGTDNEPSTLGAISEEVAKMLERADTEPANRAEAMMWTNFILAYRGVVKRDR